MAEENNNVENTLAIREIANLAKESNLAIDFNFEENGVNRDELFIAMAKNVFEQLDDLPEDQRAAVAMASMTKMLVENFAFAYTIKQVKNEEQD